MAPPTGHAPDLRTPSALPAAHAVPPHGGALDPEVARASRARSTRSSPSIPTRWSSRPIAIRIRVIPSVANLEYTMRLVSSDEVDPVRVGQQMIRVWSSRLEQGMAARARNPEREARILDLSMREIVGDPIGCVEGLYRHFDLALSDEARRRMQRYLERTSEGRVRGPSLRPRILRARGGDGERGLQGLPRAIRNRGRALLSGRAGRAPTRARACRRASAAPRRSREGSSPRTMHWRAVEKGV